MTNTRTNTPDRTNADGSTTVTTKRACNGCGTLIGDVTEAEIEAAVYGDDLPDVRNECPVCAPGETTDTPTTGRLAEIEARTNAATKGPWWNDQAEIYQGDEPILGLSEWVGETLDVDDHTKSCTNAEFIAHARADVPWLIAQLKQARGLAAALMEEDAQRDDDLAELNRRSRRVATSHQHFIDDHLDPGTEALAAQYELLNYLSAQDGETELPLNLTENALRVVLALLDEWRDDITPDEIRMALGHALPRQDMSDRRRRIYIDGKGRGWVDAPASADGTAWIGCIVPSGGHREPADVIAEAGSLREIGRCW